eukprot:COSAG01_NODE_1173_length_11400_cov_2.767366_20_plen_201_part_00
MVAPLSATVYLRCRVSAACQSGSGNPLFAFCRPSRIGEQNLHTLVATFSFWCQCISGHCAPRPLCRYEITRGVYDRWLFQGSGAWSQWVVVHRVHVLLVCRKFWFLLPNKNLPSSVAAAEAAIAEGPHPNVGHWLVTDAELTSQHALGASSNAALAVAVATVARAQPTQAASAPAAARTASRQAAVRLAGGCDAGRSRGG